MGADLSFVEVSDLGEGIAKVALNRPDKKNALNLEMFQNIVETGEKISKSDDIRAVVVCGNGDAFCAGLDLNMMGQFAEILDTLHLRTHGDCNLFQRAAMVWHDIEVPVICAIHGYAFGGGLQIACGADIKIAHADAKLSIMEMKWGIIPDMGGTYLWPQNIGIDALKDLTMNARIINGEYAKDIGMINAIAEDPIEAAIEYAVGLKDKSIQALKAQKRLYHSSFSHNRADQLMRESLEQANLLKSMLGK